ncbi:MAG: hypothetical protein ABGX27_03465, partial [Desulfurobacteriaceae bacterium]
QKTRTVSKTVNGTSEALVSKVEMLIADIREIDNISEDNSKSIEEILMKIRELYKEIDELNKIISTFKT